MQSSAVGHCPSGQSEAGPIVGRRSAPMAAAAMPVRQPRACGDLPFVIRRDGSWLYQGSPIRRKELVCLFASVLTRDATGEFTLQTPAERGRIVVEDAPFVAVELDWGLCGRTQHLSFRLNTDQVVAAGAEHAIHMRPDPATGSAIPYLHVRDGEGRFAVEARIGRAVYYELAALAVPDPAMPGEGQLGVWSDGRFFPLGCLSDA